MFVTAGVAAIVLAIMIISLGKHTTRVNDSIAKQAPLPRPDGAAPKAIIKKQPARVAREEESVSVKQPSTLVSRRSGRWTKRHQRTVPVERYEAMAKNPVEPVRQGTPDGDKLAGNREPSIIITWTTVEKVKPSKIDIKITDQCTGAVTTYSKTNDEDGREQVAVTTAVPDTESKGEEQ